MTRSPHLGLLSLSSVAILAASGCAERYRSLDYTTEDQFGRTYYIDGAGNWGYGVAEVPKGLQGAGYLGRVVVFPWSPFRSPALDQTLGRGAAKTRGKELAAEIVVYLKSFPGRKVNVIALSAGTGVAVWACENMAPPGKIHNLVLLGSSLSSTYDMSKALAHIEGGVFVYHSDKDAVLKLAVPLTGTIDGCSGESAGLVGLQLASGEETRIWNIAWFPDQARLGWTGSHTSCTAEPFVRAVLAAHIIDGSESFYASARPSGDRAGG